MAKTIGRKSSAAAKRRGQIEDTQVYIHQNADDIFRHRDKLEEYDSGMLMVKCSIHSNNDCNAATSDDDGGDDDGGDGHG